jgi:hypothetical protein
MADSGVPVGNERGASGAGQDRTRPFRWENYRLAVHAEYRADEPQFLEQWPAFAPQVELQEPFGRIREAIDEARASVR